MGYCKDPFHLKRQNQRVKKTMGTFLKLGAGIAAIAINEVSTQRRAIAKSNAAYERLLKQEERDRIRQAKQDEAAERRKARELAKAERERQKAAILQSKKQEQERLELEIKSIESENELWTNVQCYCNSIITANDILQEIEKCKAEHQNYQSNYLYQIEHPQKTDSEAIATKEAGTKFNTTSLEYIVRDIKAKLRNFTFKEEEPTKENIRKELTEQAKQTIKSFWPWKKKKLRAEFIDSQLEVLFSTRYNSWKENKSRYEVSLKETTDLLKKQEQELSKTLQAKQNFIISRTQELFDQEVCRWKDDRNNCFDNYLKNLQNIIDGDAEYVCEAIRTSFMMDINDIPIEYFVEFAYDESKGRVIVDLDLPEIEDIPERKVTITPTGKKSIRQKSQTDLKSDYANCVFGLGMYVADIIFNTSLKIKEVQISAYTQRKDNNSAIPSNHYVYLVNFNRGLFSDIDFCQFSAIQIMDFFKHHFNMTKSFDLKTIELSSAQNKMETFITANYEEFVNKLVAE